MAYAIALVCVAGIAEGQEAARTAPVERATSRHLLVGDLAFELRSPNRGTLMLGFADDRQAVSLEVRATDARRWADSVRRLIALRPPARPRPAAKGRGVAPRTKGGMAPPAPARRVRAILEEPGVGAGSLLLTRIDSAGETLWTLYAADGDLAEVKESLATSEARVVVNVLRTAAIAAAPPPMRRGPARKQPAKKAPAKKAPTNESPASTPKRPGAR